MNKRINWLKDTLIKTKEHWPTYWSKTAVMKLNEWVYWLKDTVIKTKRKSNGWLILIKDVCDETQSKNQLVERYWIKSKEHGLTDSYILTRYDLLLPNIHFLYSSLNSMKTNSELSNICRCNSMQQIFKCRLNNDIGT